MSFQGMDHDRHLLSLPQTPPEELARMASERPDLWVEIQTHPNVYPELVEWMVANSAQPQTPSEAFGATGQPTMAAGADASGVLAAGATSAGGPAAAPVASPAKKKKGVKTALVIGVSAFLVGAVLGVGAWFLFGKEKVEESTAYGSLPVLSSAAAVASPDTPIELIPIGQTGYLASDKLVVAAAYVGGQQMLVGVEEGSIGAPAWTATVSQSLSDCTLEGGALRCGSETVDTRSGAVTEVPGTSSSDETSKKDVDGDQVDEGPTDADQEGEGAQLERDEAKQTPQAPADADYTMEGTALLDKNGNTITTFGSTPVWQQGSGGGVVVFSDGGKVAAAKGTKLLWEVELEDGSEEVNFAEGSKAPISADSQTVIVGEPTGIIGLNVGTGEETWHLETPVDTWFASGDILMVGAQGAIYQMSFPTDGQDTVAGTEELIQLEAPAGLSWEDLANAALVIPNGCASTGGPVQFTDGEAQGISLDTVEPMSVGGEAFAVAQVSCTSAVGVARYWAIYDADVNLVADGFMSKVPGFGWYEIPYYTLGEPLSVAGTQFTYTLGDVELMQGSTEVTVTYGFNGSEARVEDVVYYLASGETRAPKLDEVQALYDTIAAGQEDSVAGQISAQELNAIKTGVLGDGMDGISNYRKYLYPVGGKISACVLAAPTYQQGILIVDDLGVAFYGTDKDYMASEYEPGEWLCGIETPPGEFGTGGIQDWPGEPTYPQNLRVTTDVEGTPTIVMTDRTFS